MAILMASMFRLNRVPKATCGAQRPRTDARIQPSCAAVAQLDRAQAYEAWGRGFESPRARQSLCAGAPPMAASIEEITREVVELPRHQRMALIRLLLDLDQPGTSDEIDRAWDEEIRARVKAIDEGRAVGIPFEQIKKEMVGRFPPR
jgi:putative addiction module component (TIGR02574 family)